MYAIRSYYEFVAINQLTIVIGVLAAQIVNLMIAQPVGSGSSMADISTSWNGQLGWRYMFGAELVPAVAFLVLMFLVPESPRWLVKMGKGNLAVNSLMKIGSRQYAEKTVLEIESTLSSDMKHVITSYSIHYTKLYDGCSSRAPPFRPSPFVIA